MYIFIFTSIYIFVFVFLGRLGGAVGGSFWHLFIPICLLTISPCQAPRMCQVIFMIISSTSIIINITSITIVTIVTIVLHLLGQASIRSKQQCEQGGDCQLKLLPSYFRLLVRRKEILFQSLIQIFSSLFIIKNHGRTKINTFQFQGNMFISILIYHRHSGRSLDNNERQSTDKQKLFVSYE